MADEIKRMCKWNKKRLKKDLEAFSSEVREAGYVCSDCIRVAGSKKRLCHPVALTGQASPHPPQPGPHTPGKGDAHAKS